MNRTAFVLAISALVCSMHTPASAIVIEKPPAYDELVGCWVGLEGGTLLRLCLAKDSTATLRYESNTGGKYFSDELSDIVVDLGKLSASIQGDGYPEAARVKGDAKSYMIELRLPPSAKYRKRSVRLFWEANVEAQWRDVVEGK